MSDFTFRNKCILIIAILLATLIGWLSAVSQNWLIIIPIFIVIVIIIMRPFWGLLLFVFLIPLESSFLSLSDGAASVTRFVGLFVFSVWLVGKITNHRKLFIPSNLKVAIGFVIWGILSIIWAYDKSVTNSRIITAIQLLMLLLLIINLIKDQKQLKALLLSLYIGCFTVTSLGFFGIGVNNNSYLLTLQNQGAKEYGLYVGIFFLLGSLLFVFEKKPIRWIGLAAVFFSVVPLMQVNQRGIFLAIGISWLAIAFITRQKAKSVIFIGFLALLISFLPSLLVQNNYITAYNADRLSIQNLLATGGTGRIEIWTVGSRMIKDNLIIGTGWGNFPVLFSKYANSIELVMSNFTIGGKDPHGDLIGVAGELGLIGLLLFLLLYLKLLIQNIALLNKLTNPSGKILVIFVIELLVYIFSAGLTSTFLWRKVYWLILGLAIVVPYLFSSITSEKNSRV